jgi:hypothetical protein
MLDLAEPQHEHRPFHEFWTPELPDVRLQLQAVTRASRKSDADTGQIIRGRLRAP